MYGKIRKPRPVVTTYIQNSCWLRPQEPTFLNPTIRLQLQSPSFAFKKKLDTIIYCSTFNTRTKMKFYTAFAFALLAGNAAGFSAVAPGKTASTSASTGPSSEPIDKTMRSIDNEPGFDPAEGENAALKRNNMGEVWNEQVWSLELLFRF